MMCAILSPLFSTMVWSPKFLSTEYLTANVFQRFYMHSWSWFKFIGRCCCCRRYCGCRFRSSCCCFFVVISRVVCRGRRVLWWYMWKREHKLFQQCVVVYVCSDDEEEEEEKNSASQRYVTFVLAISKLLYVVSVSRYGRSVFML